MLRKSSQNQVKKIVRCPQGTACPKQWDDCLLNHKICSKYVNGTCTWGERCGFVHQKAIIPLNINPSMSTDLMQRCGSPFSVGTTVSDLTDDRSIPSPILVTPIARPTSSGIEAKKGTPKNAWIRQSTQRLELDEDGFLPAPARSFRQDAHSVSTTNSFGGGYTTDTRSRGSAFKSGGNSSFSSTANSTASTNDRAERMYSREEIKKMCEKVHNGIFFWSKSDLSFDQKLSQYEANHDTYTMGKFSSSNRGKVITSLAENAHIPANVEMLKYLNEKYHSLYSYHNIKMDSPTTEFSFRPINLALWFGGRKLSQVNLGNGGRDSLINSLKRVINTLLELGYGFNLYGETETFLGPLANPANKLDAGIKEEIYEFIFSPQCKINWAYEFGLTLSDINENGYRQYVFLASILSNPSHSFKMLYDHIDRSFFSQIGFGEKGSVESLKNTLAPLISLVMRTGISHYNYVEEEQVYEKSEFSKFFQMNSASIDSIAQNFLKYFVSTHAKRIEEISKTERGEMEMPQLVLMKLYFLGSALKQEKKNISDLGMEGERSELMETIIKEIKATVASNISAVMNDKVGDLKIPGIVYLLKTSGIQLVDGDQLDKEIISDILENLSVYRGTINSIQFEIRSKAFDRGIRMYTDNTLGFNSVTLTIQPIGTPTVGAPIVSRSTGSAPIADLPTDSENKLDGDIVNGIVDFLDGKGDESCFQEFQLSLKKLDKYQSNFDMALAICDQLVWAFDLDKFGTLVKFIEDDMSGLVEIIKSIHSLRPDAWVLFCEDCLDFEDRIAFITK